MQDISETSSICPICLNPVPARLVDNKGKVEIVKTCETHGVFTDVYWGDTRNYEYVMSFFQDGCGIENPVIRTSGGCPKDCGLCENHENNTVLGIVDVTGRCNLACPICFADANARCNDLTHDDIGSALDALRSQRPVPPIAVQYSGGEPTVRDDLDELVGLALAKGFLHVEVNTNGLRFAEDVDYLKRVVDSGMRVMYLQFDGLDDEVYLKLRGRRILAEKLKVIENCRQLGFSMLVLVVTLAKGVNDQMVGDIIRFAFENRDVVRVVNFQPISFSGRAQDSPKSGRITSYDFMQAAEKQSSLKIKDFYPIPSVKSIIEALGYFVGRREPAFACHPCCGVGTYIVADGGKFRPLLDIVDLHKVDHICREALHHVKGRKPSLAGNILWRIKHGLRLARVFLSSPSKRFRGLIFKSMLTASSRPLMDFMFTDVVMVGCMHFMDPGNFDLARARRCVIHYGLPDGRIMPFCTYNSIHRAKAT